MRVKRNKGFLGFFFFVCLTALPVFAFGQNHGDKKHELVIFYSPSCHECAKLKSQIMPQIANKFRGQLLVTYYSIDEIASYKMLLSLEEQYKASIKNVVPILFLEGHFMEAGDKPAKAVESFVEKSIRTSIAQEKALNDIDLLERFKAFKPAVVCGAGLIDGINPCAFTVIVFFISFLALQGYRRKELVAIGGAFILSVFLTYLLIGVGLFGFLFSLKTYWVFMRVLNIGIGLFSITLGCLALYDFFNFRKNRDTENLLLQLPPAIKNQIHKVIGLHYRKTASGERAAADKTTLFRLILSALITGFLVSLLEAVCTGQTYLPTIVFVLKTTPYKLVAFLYLVIYNLMFIIPLIIIFILALYGTTSGQFSYFLKKNILKIKLLMAALFFALGLFLIWRV
ncbi:MAG: hypothetical protein NT033_10100 [Candidatus Omnitrophica bacterium]|nr:hypothetical protein [Candidatus Omnitrophota bacterium]